MVNEYRILINICMGEAHSLSIYSKTPPPTPSAGNCIHRRRQCLLFSRSSTHLLHHPFLVLRAVSNESNGSERGGVERSEADRMVDAMDFGELCNEFECFSSPLVESTARQLARDILQLRKPNFPLATSVIYKDPVRSFIGRDKYKRPLWVSGAFENPFVTVEKMEMLSTSELRIKWRIRGRLKWLTNGEELTVKVNSRFTLNQISGQVIEHQEVWDLSASSSTIAQFFFWTSCRLSAAIDAAKDLGDLPKKYLSSQKPNLDQVYPQPSVDPTKFFQTDDGFQRDAYQFVFFVALVYFVVQFLRTTL